MDRLDAIVHEPFRRESDTRSHLSILSVFLWRGIVGHHPIGTFGLVNSEGLQAWQTERVGHDLDEAAAAFRDVRPDWPTSGYGLARV